MTVVGCADSDRIAVSSGSWITVVKVTGNLFVAIAQREREGGREGGRERESREREREREFMNRRQTDKHADRQVDR